MQLLQSVVPKKRPYLPQGGVFWNSKGKQVSKVSKYEPKQQFPEGWGKGFKLKNSLLGINYVLWNNTIAFWCWMHHPATWPNCWLFQSVADYWGLNRIWILWHLFSSSSANASPEFEGRGGDELGTMLAKTLERAYNHKSAIDLESLCILPGKQCWVLYVDALVWLLVTWSQ